MKLIILNKIKYIICTIVLILLFILGILFIYEKIYSLSDEARWNRDNIVTNEMNVKKLKNSDWESESFIWLYKDETLPPKSNKKRILIVGDSYVWGDGYNNANYIWWQQLRNKLLENGYNDVELVAMGMRGYNTKQQHQMLVDADIKNSINPDLIVFAYVDNDTESWQNPYDSNDIWTKAKADYGALRNLLPTFFNDFAQKAYPFLYNKINGMLVEKYSSLNSVVGIKYMDYQEIIHQEIFLDNYLEYVLKPLKKYLEIELQIPYFFVEMPFFPSNLAQEQINLAKEKFDEIEMPFYELTSDYTSEVPYYDINVYQITPANAHPGPKTTEFTARKVLEILERDYKEILGEKTKVQMDEIIINDPMPRTMGLKQLDNNTFSFTYPANDSSNSFFTMPIKKNYIKLNLMYPIDIKSIEISGDNIEDVNIYINKINQELGYDDKIMHKYDYREKYIWDLNCDNVSSININADIKNGASSNLTIKIVKE